jgi:HSP90 family molecular chaperone
MPASERVLEINPEHPIVVNLVKLHAQQSEGIEPFGRLLLDHATISEGRLEDPQGFAGRLQVLMERAAAGMAQA